MQIYQVGGSVRDAYMGVPSQDRDWVVVGAKPQDLLDLGYRQVGADFPVFLHPETNEEFALARVERKTGAGYLGFEVRTQDVTLEEDLMRRDLTINAMAQTTDGKLVDPYNGLADLRNRVLRHVGPAFAEDPVRILRILRFQARYGEAWTVAPSTDQLVRSMVANGEASNLVSERIWKEASRALMERSPTLFVAGLLSWGLTELPCFKAYRHANVDRQDTLQRCVWQDASLATRFAVAFASPDHAERGVAYPGVPSEVVKVAGLWAEFSENVSWVLRPQDHAHEVLRLLQRADAFKPTSMLADFVAGWHAWGLDTKPFDEAVARARAVDTKSISSAMPPGPAVGRAIEDARLAALQSTS